MSRILVIDDEPIVLDSLHVLLSSSGFQVELAKTAEEANRIFPKFHPHLVIVDYMLQDTIDGVSLAESLQAADSDLATIIVTGYPSEHVQARVRKLHNTQFLPKPVSAEILITTAKQMMTS